MQPSTHGAVLTRLIAGVETPPFDAQQNTALTPGPEGRLVSSGFPIPTGVTVALLLRRHWRHDR